MARSAPDYPKSGDWDEFERLCRALLSEVRGVKFQRWGDQDHRQDGADAWAMLDNGQALVLQCKGRSRSFGKSLSLANVDAAVREIDTFPHPVEELIILTTTPDSVNLHSHATRLSRQRAALGQSRVSIQGWNSICTQIEQHKPIRKAYFRPWLLRRPWWQWLLLAIAAAVFALAWLAVKSV
ncbi:hypothetical protein LJR289_005167 [Pseudoduganella sp. LjRoot289]|uniref:hypothetical protein n=1 Tax=Pseudoduganella sp. LjRoot289 TaxID=3342314 RepID=UPI003ED07D30